MHRMPIESNLIDICLDYILRNPPRANKHIQILFKEYLREKQKKAENRQLRIYIRVDNSPDAISDSG